jgi:WD40 repeat protein
MNVSTLSTPENELEDIILAYLTAADAGQAPSRQDLLNHYPEFASDLAAFFADQDQTASYVSPLRNVGPAGALVPQDPSFGDYQLLEELGRGGMGVVFKAHQIGLHRPVALKMILAGHLASVADVQRFRAEAEMGASLNHPHVVPIYEIGEHQGQHFFSMKLMESGSLANQIQEGRWKLRDRQEQRKAAQLIATIARAVEHAHQRGLLHRDLKPGNILFDQDERPHVSDFGLSKRVQPVAEGEPATGASRTVSGLVVGTPSYMAPEQATAPRSITTAADVYSLGAVLYELLAGKAPFQGETPIETLLHVARVEPPPPRSLNSLIDRDLETIALKCLEKDPRGRYVSAAALAGDLERWLAGEPILARPAGLLERTAKWSKRRPAHAALSALVAVVLLAGIGSLVWNWQAAEAAKRENAQRAAQEAVEKRLETARADQEARDKRRLAAKLYFKNIALARLEFADNNLLRANELLSECDADLRGWEWHFLDRYFHPEVMTLRQHTTGVVSLAFSTDGDRLVSLSSVMHNRRVYDDVLGHRKPTTTSMQGAGGAIRIIRTSDGRELLRVDPKADLVCCVALSPDGKAVACSGSTPSENGFIKVFDAHNGAERFTMASHSGPVRSIAYSPQGQYLASGGDDGMAKLWDTKTGKLVRTIAARDSSITSLGAIGFSPDGKHLAGALTEAATVRIWDTVAGRQVRELRGHTGNVTHLVFSPDGGRLATASEDRMVKVWNMETGRELLTLVGHTDGVASVAFSPDGQRLVSAGYDNTIRVWDSASGLLCFTLAGHNRAVLDVAYSPDGNRIATASLDDTIKLWSAREGHAAIALRTAGGIAGSLAFSPDGRHVAGRCGQRSEDVVVLDAATGAGLRSFKGHEKQITMVAYAPDGKRLASVSLDNTVRVWDILTGHAVHTLRLGPRSSAGTTYQGLAFNSDGKRIAAAGGEEAIKVWDANTGQLLHDFHEGARSLAFSPDARRLACAGPNGLKVHDAVAGAEIYAVKGDFDFVLFSPDGTRLIALGTGGLKILEAATGKLEREVRSRPGQRSDLAAISPDGRRLALIGARDVIRLLDTSSWEEALALPGHAASVLGVAFSPDGHRIASSDLEGVMSFWDATPRRASIDRPQ